MEKNWGDTPSATLKGNTFSKIAKNTYWANFKFKISSRTTQPTVL